MIKAIGSSAEDYGRVIVYVVPLYNMQVYGRQDIPEICNSMGKVTYILDD